MASFKNLHNTSFPLSRNLNCPLSRSRTKGFFTLFLTLALIIFCFPPSNNKFPPVYSTILASRLHSAASNYSSSSSVVSPHAYLVSEPPRSCTDTVTLSAAERTKKSARNADGSGIKDFSSCDIFDGHWIVDDSAEPLYPPGSCPYVDDSFNCFKNGRPDADYLKLRWKPHGCEIPRFDGLEMLKLLKGKRVVFVGDSLNRNMWKSLVCALRGSLGNKSRVYQVSSYREFRNQGFYSFWFEDYKCSIDFIKSPFLVQERKFSDKAGTRRETLRLDLIQDSSSKYHDADIIIFNTGHWWTHHNTFKGNNYFQEGSRVYKRLEVADAYAKALRTWAQWVDANINSSHTRVFFRGYSASHFKWSMELRGSCDGETLPIKNDTYLSPYPRMMIVLESVISEMKTPVFYLNITKMTDYRKDGHPSIYRQPELHRVPGMIQDCSHWCLPGVPDSWIELLYATLLRSHKSFPLEL